MCIANLRGDFPELAIGYQSKEDAIEELRQRTGQDFGLDVTKWESWLAENPEVVAEKAKTPKDALRLARALKPQK
jgi:hypothetical protein